MNALLVAVVGGALLVLSPSALLQAAAPQARSAQEGDAIHAEVRGRWRKSGGTGGERTGFHISAGAITWEVDASATDALLRTAKRLDGKRAIATGTYERRGSRHVLLARRLESGRGRGESIEVTVRGTLDTGVMAIGAETTGVTITSNATTWELDLDERQLEAAEKLAGRRITLSGRLRHHAGVEIRDRYIVKVRSIRPRR